MMRMQASWVRIIIDLMFSADLLRFWSVALIFFAASMAVWEWNSAAGISQRSEYHEEVESMYLDMRL